MFKTLQFLPESRIILGNWTGFQLYSKKFSMWDAVSFQKNVCKAFQIKTNNTLNFAIGFYCSSLLYCLYYLIQI